MNPVLRIATRKSALAMWQARHVRELLETRYAGLSVELVPVVTEGDRIVDRPLASIGGKGLFLKELEQALWEGRADFAVHSMKDVPAEDAPGLDLVAALKRANPGDAWLARDGHTLQSLPMGSRVGTSSLRRQCQLLARRPDLHAVDLRGNVDTRLDKLQAGEYDAIILACAGLERLGLTAHITQVLEPPTWLPAPTQGIIGLQCRSDDTDTRELLKPLTDAESTIQASAERAVARIVQGSCQVPVAVYAELEGSRLTIHALVGSPDGRTLIRASGQGGTDDGAAVADRVARELLAGGAGEVIARLQDR